MPLSRSYIILALNMSMNLIFSKQFENQFKQDWNNSIITLEDKTAMTVKDWKTIMSLGI